MTPVSILLVYVAGAFTGVGMVTRDPLVFLTVMLIVYIIHIIERKQ